MEKSDPMPYVATKAEIEELKSICHHFISMVFRFDSMGNIDVIGRCLA